MRTGTILFAQAQQDGDKPADKKDAEQQPGITQFLPFILIAVMFYMMIIAPGRRERQRQQQLLNNLKKNDEVVTSSGILGVVVSVKENGNEVTIKSDETRLRVLKSTIVQILNPKETPASGAPGQEQPQGKA
jgi:preprotein translocase subunit YajC